MILFHFYRKFRPENEDWYMSFRDRQSEPRKPSGANASTVMSVKSVKGAEQGAVGGGGDEKSAADMDVKPASTNGSIDGNTMASNPLAPGTKGAAAPAETSAQGSDPRRGSDDSRLPLATAAVPAGRRSDAEDDRNSHSDPPPRVPQKEQDIALQPLGGRPSVPPKGDVNV